jgi:hypothetical protein
MLTDAELLSRVTGDTRGWDAAEGPRWGAMVFDHESSEMVGLTVVAETEDEVRKLAEEYAIRILQLEDGDYEVMDDVEREEG